MTILSVKVFELVVLASYGFGLVVRVPRLKVCTLGKSIWEQILEPAFLLEIGTGADLWTSLVLESELAHFFWLDAQPVILKLGHTKQWVKQECTALKWEEEKNPRLHLWCIPSKNGNTLIGKLTLLITLTYMSLYCKSLKHTFYLKRVLTIQLTCNQKLRKEVKGSHIVSQGEPKGISLYMQIVYQLHLHVFVYKLATSYILVKNNNRPDSVLVMILSQAMTPHHHHSQTCLFLGWWQRPGSRRHWRGWGVQDQ